MAELHSVPDAYVPIIKIEFAGVSIDLIFVSLLLSRVPTELKLADTALLRGLDEAAMRSVNGTRVTDELLASVPQVKTFRHATRAIKLWAQRTCPRWGPQTADGAGRGIYGAVFGYPGGVAWAIMVARICQLYPFACGATVVCKFFTLLLKWHWPRPVMLKQIEEGIMGLRVWNPQVGPAAGVQAALTDQIYAGDRAHLMPIITPAFPSMCATHTVMHSTLDTMMNEMRRADGIISHVLAGKQSWKDLFAPHTFFTVDHKYYLQVVAASRGSREVHGTWAGWVQSKARLLVKGIDDAQSGVACARPYMKAVDRMHRCKTEDDADHVVQGSMDHLVAGGGGGDGDGDVVYTTTFYVGITLQEGGCPVPRGGGPAQCAPGTGRHLDISYPVHDFKRVVQSWPSYDADLHSIRVVHTRKYAARAHAALLTDAAMTCRRTCLGPARSGQCGSSGRASRGRRPSRPSAASPKRP